MKFLKKKENEKEVFDVYIHKFIADEDVLDYNLEGEFLKTYKTEKGAITLLKNKVIQFYKIWGNFPLKKCGKENEKRKNLFYFKIRKWAN